MTQVCDLLYFSRLLSFIRTRISASKASSSCLLSPSCNSQASIRTVAMAALPNVWNLRTVAEASTKSCYICYKPTTAVLITSDNKVRLAALLERVPILLIPAMNYPCQHFARRTSSMSARSISKTKDLQVQS